MSENVTNELILEHLKRLHSGQNQILERLDRIEGRLTAVETHIAAMIQSVSRIDSDIDSLSRRVNRIENRLDLAESH